MTDAKHVLSGSALFAGADDAMITELLERAATIHFAPGEIPVAEATVSDQILMIVEGDLKMEVALLVVDKEVKLLHAGPGMFLGLVNFFGIVPQPCTVTALTEVKALAWKANELRELCEANPAFGYQLSQRIGHALVERMSKWITDLLDNVSWGM